FAPGVLAAFALVLAAGWSQRFGGLEETRRYFYAYVYPTMQDVPPEYLKKMASNRIFSTLFYPNALAGALLLVTPFCLAAIAGARRWFTAGARWFLCLVVAAASLACLYWSGSKGGWLLMLLLSLVALLRLRFPRRFKVALVGLVLLAGLAGFFLKYAGFFEKGATSVAARFDYWHAALETAEAHPLVGTGPGTFARPYERLKRPESEMSRLTHNDYLEQASDSGWPAFLLYVAFVVGGLIYGYPRQAPGKGAEGGKDNWLAFAVWLGVLGWALQSAEEFSLYIPALAWLACAWLGWLLRERSAEFSPQRSPKASRVAT
ncbi:MAG: O-antigen ligase family protein, partial [Limisphaerales bacterium]